MIFSNKTNRSIAGFTLIELLVTISIIGMLSTLAIVAIGEARANARDSVRLSDMSQLRKALEQYNVDHQSYVTKDTPGYNCDVDCKGGRGNAHSANSNDDDYFIENVLADYIKEGIRFDDPFEGTTQEKYYYFYVGNSNICESDQFLTFLIVNRLESPRTEIQGNYNPADCDFLPVQTALDGYFNSGAYIYQFAWPK